MGESNDTLFAAVANPVRRQLLERCMHTDEVAVADLAQEVDVSASALSQHLKVLRDAGLVAQRKTGRRVYYRLTPEPLIELLEFADRVRQAWEARLDRLGEYLDSEHNQGQRTRLHSRPRRKAGR